MQHYLQCHVTAEGLGKNYPWIWGHTFICNVSEIPIHPNNIYISIPSHRKHTGCPITKTNELLFRDKKLGVCCEKDTKYISELRGHNLQFRVNSDRQANTGINLCEYENKSASLLGHNKELGKGINDNSVYDAYLKCVIPFFTE
jgi:hypothetical protein